MQILSNLSLYGTLGLNSVADANTDTDKFLVIDSSGIVKYRTGAELYNDIGAGGAAAYTSVLQHTVKAGVALTKGQAVYVTSADGTNMIVGKASNASEATSSKTLGLIVQDLAINDQGFVITEGLLSGLDTSTANAGDPVWLGTDGNLIYGLGAKPYAPAHLVFIGIVTRVQQNNGEIFVKVQNGFELQELHNVQITSTPSDNAVLAYETSTSLYKMKSIPTLLGYTPVTNARSITINGTTYDLSADRSWSVGTHTGNLTTGYIPKATGATTLTDSLIYDNGSAIGINTSSPYESSAFKLDVNGGLLIKNTSGTTAQLVLINSNPATGGNNGFVQLSAGGNTDTTFGQWQTYYGMSVASGALRLQPAGGQVLIGTTTTSAFLTDINGTLRVSGQLTLGSTISNNTYVYTMPGASGTLALVSQIPSLSGYLTIASADATYLTQSSAASIYLSQTSASNTYLTISGAASTYLSQASASNTYLTISGASSIYLSQTSASNTYLTINGASITYLSQTSASNTYLTINNAASNYVSLTGSYANPSWITSLAWSKITGAPAFITGITSGMVTTALGYTPYDSSNPSGYIAANSSASGWISFSSSTQGTPIIKAVQQDTGSGFYLFQGVTGSTEVFRVDRAGDIYMANNLVATRSWVQAQGYITGVTNISGYSYNLYSQDIRTIAPNSHGSYRLNFGFTSWNNNNTADWADYIHLRSYSDGSGGADNLVMFKKNGIGMRIWQQSFGSSSPYSSYVDVLHSGNYLSYRGNQLVSPNGATVVAADSAMPDSGHSFIHTLALGPSGNDGHILGMTWASTTSVYGAQIWVDTDPNNRMAFRSRSSTGVWTGWNEVIHSSNYNGYAPTLTGGGASGTWGISITGNADTVDGYHASGLLKLNEWNGNLYLHTDGRIYGTIFYDANNSDYYLDPNGMSKQVQLTNLGTYGSNAANARNHFVQYNAGTATPATGWIAAAFGDASANRVVIGQWGSTTQAIIGSHTGSLNDWAPLGYAATEHIFYAPSWTSSEKTKINSNGIYAPAYRGNDNVGGTGTATWHPDGIYSGGTEWLYGTMYRNGSSTYYAGGWEYQVGGIEFNSGPSFQVNNSRNLQLNSGGAADVGIYGRGNGGQFAFQLYGNGSGSYGFLDGVWAAWDLRKAVDGSLYMNDNDSYYLNTTSNSYVYRLESATDLRAPIFYDSNNTGYYLDLNSTTSLRTVGSWRADSSAWDGEFSGKIQYHSNSWYLQAADLFIYRNSGGSNVFTVTQGGVAQASADFRAPIFYDSGDTGYYLDPNDTSNLWRFTEGTLNRHSLNSRQVNSPWSTRASQGTLYQTGAMGWGQNDLNVIGSNWGSGFFDTWSSPGNRPSTASGHWVGMQAFHYNNSDSSRFHGWQMACAQEADNRWYWRSAWDTPRSWVEMIHSGNIGSQSVNYASSAGNADTVDGYHASAFPFRSSGSSGYYQVADWMQFNTSAGIYWPGYNGAHIYANTSGNYGSIRIDGTRNGWKGIYFDSGNTLMMNANESGHYQDGYGWKWRWYNGTMYVSTGSYGGGTEYVVLHTGGATLTNVFYYRSDRNTDSSNAPLQAYSGNGGGATMAFHRGGYYAVNFGLDSDNVMRIGGWSASTNRWQLDMSGNMTVAGDVTAYSDARVKENVITVDNALNKVLALRGVYYNRTDSEDKNRKIGVIAQETMTIIPEVVNQDNAGMYNVSYGNLGGLFIEAFKEQQKRIEAQDRVIEELKSKLDAVTK